MLGRKEREQLELFVTGSLRQLVPDDHILARGSQCRRWLASRAREADLFAV